jgi:hypothetical protein
MILAMGVGIAAGLVVSWWLWPVEYTDVSPDTLHAYHRAEYIVLVSHAYAHDRDLRRAQVRLAALGDLGSVGVEVVTLAEQYAAQGRSLHDTQSLARLAHILGHRRAALAPFMPGGAPTATLTPWPTATATATEAPTATETPTATPAATPTATPTVVPTETPTELPRLTPRLTPTLTPVTEPTPTRRPTRTPRHTNTPRPTLTPTITSTPEPHFALATQARRCGGAGGASGLLQITVLDAKGQPLPSIELLIRWQDGEDRFFTGLKPERGAGYADYDLAAGKSYQVGIVGLESDVAQGIVADACEDGGRANWTLVFRLQGSAP